MLSHIHALQMSDSLPPARFGIITLCTRSQAARTWLLTGALWYTVRAVKCEPGYRCNVPGSFFVRTLSKLVTLAPPDWEFPMSAAPLPSFQWASFRLV